jgi:hypothetical protein
MENCLKKFIDWGTARCTLHQKREIGGCGEKILLLKGCIDANTCKIELF